MMMIFISGYSYTVINNQKKQLDQITNVNMAKILTTASLRNNLNVVVRSVNNYVIYKDAVRMGETTRKITEYRENVDKAMTSLGDLLNANDEERALFQKLVGHRTATRPLLKAVVTLVNDGQLDNAVETLSTAQVSTDAWFETMNTIIAKQTENYKTVVEEADQLTMRISMLLGGILILAIMLSIVLTLAIKNVIVNSIDESIKVAKSITDGDLTTELIDIPNTEVGVLMHELMRMSGTLKSIISQVKSSAENINTGAGEIAAGNMDLSSRTEQQASSLEETASSMEELTSTVHNNRDNAMHANKMAIDANKVASTAGVMVDDVISRISNINASSTKIVDIIDVIQKIAFQTNILALNAAVEAARAGEQGRGFAVVATEVRTLAQRTTAAAKEIQDLILDSVQQISAGNEVAINVGGVMKDVVVSVQKVTNVISEISKASEEQSSGIDQVNIAITEMDTVTQQNAALVEEAASAADSLLQQARSLNYITEKFILEKKAVLTGAARIKDKHDKFMEDMAARKAELANK